MRSSSSGQACGRRPYWMTARPHNDARIILIALLSAAWVDPRWIPRYTLEKRYAANYARLPIATHPRNGICCAFGSYAVTGSLSACVASQCRRTRLPQPVAHQRMGADRDFELRCRAGRSNRSAHWMKMLSPENARAQYRHRRHTLHDTTRGTITGRDIAKPPGTFPWFHLQPLFQPDEHASRQ